MAQKKSTKAKRISRNETVWCNRGWQFAFYGFCPNEIAWKKTLKQLKVQQDVPYPTNDACVQELVSDSGKTCHVVFINKRLDKKYRNDLSGMVGLIVHECTHVLQHILDHMGEKVRPSPEFEAYAMQAITSEIFEAYLATRIRRVR